MMEIRIPPGNTTGGRNEKLDSGNVAFFTSLFPQHIKRMLGDWQLGVSFFFLVFVLLFVLSLSLLRFLWFLFMCQARVVQCFLPIIIGRLISR